MTIAEPCTLARRPDTRVTTLLCDADGTLFPSEEPAFLASAVITQQLAQRYGLTGDFSGEGLRRATTGKNFRATAIAMLEQAGVDVDPAELEEWIGREREVVTAYLSDVLTVQDDVVDAVRRLAECFELAVVSSSARSRLDACFQATGLTDLFPAGVRFSAEDSLPAPVSKPDPAIYHHALDELGLAADRTIAIEDSSSGVEAAVRAGIPTIGIVVFVRQEEQADRTAQLRRAGALDVVPTWADLIDRLSSC
jgi:beta-phosphoglucomutase-like phosphatase (HAD superfamily)